MAAWHGIDAAYMARALALAAHGQGLVEPNPMVGAVVVNQNEVVGQGWHQQYGGPHAEVVALSAAGESVAGGTLYVTLEPCCHFGKTPPCTQAILDSGVRRVVAAMADPFPQVSGQGLAQLAAAGVEVCVGALEKDAKALNAPYLKLVSKQRPWIVAKWAMTLDGKLASRSGESRWISSPASREIVHKLRGRVDAIVVGSRTALLDDPLLTARPPGPRTALRVVVDSRASLASASRLVATARETPLLVAVASEASASDRDRLAALGCDVFVCAGETHAERLNALLDELGRRRLTNVLVEGGGRLLGSLFDLGEIDEAHVFIAPKLLGGESASSPLGGLGLDRMAAARLFDTLAVDRLGPDLYLHGRLTS